MTGGGIRSEVTSEVILVIGTEILHGRLRGRLSKVVRIRAVCWNSTVTNVLLVIVG